MKISTLLVLAAFLLSWIASAQPSACALFTRWDKNQDGTLTAEELPERIRARFAQIDADKDGKITVEENSAFIERAKNIRADKPQAGAPQMNQQFRDAIVSHLDIPYASDDNPRHRLDLFLPKAPTDKAPLPLLVYIHGGGWRNGTKDGGGRRVAEFVASGNYAGASIGYRLTDEARWPAQIHDCKAAIRWIKANAAKYNIDPDRIAVWGTSAGGHLVSMLGVTNGDKELEGSLGEHLDQNSRVACVPDWFGPSNLFTIAEQRGRVQKQSAETPLLGGSAKDQPELGRSASPVFHVTPDTPPFLIAHGDKDNTVPFAQSEEFVEAMRKAGVDPAPILIRFEGGGHGQGIAGPELSKIMTAFLDLHLRGQKADLKNATLPPYFPNR